MRRARRKTLLGLPLLVALLGALALPPSAGAAELFPLTIEVFSGGEVKCKVGSGSLGKCQPEYASDKQLTLVAIPEEGYKFAGWEFGAGSAESCEGTGACVFTITEESSVEAVFELITLSLVINYPGPGEGEVLCAADDSPPGGWTCEDEYEFGAKITLFPEAFEGSQFVGFKNGTGSAASCSGAGPCSFVLKASSSIEAPFGPIMRSLSILKSGTGQGTVTCNGVACAPSYAENTEVVLAAIPAAGSSFAGWSGAGCSGTGSCSVTLSADAAVTATFSASSQLPSPEAKEGKARAGAIAKVKAGKAKAKLTCSGGPCQGVLKLTAKLSGKKVVIGKAPFDLAEGALKAIPVRLSAAAKRQLEKSGSLRAKASGPGMTVGSVTLKLLQR